MFNPLRHKKPYGATAIGKITSIEFPLDSNIEVKWFSVVLRKNEKLKTLKLKLKSRGEYENIYYVEFKISEFGIWHYRFELQTTNGEMLYFGRFYNGDAICGELLPEWQLTVTKYDYKTPDWAKQGVIYQIFADRFCRTGEINFNKNGMLHQDWNERPLIETEGLNYMADDYFGGNIKGIISKLDYIKSLGVSCIYLTPIFESSSNHRYDTGDFLKIDELFGTEDEFKELIKKAKSKNINIMLDGVFNHTGSNSLYFNKNASYPTLGAYQSKESPYYDWYTFNEFPNNYHCWWGSTVVPTVAKGCKGFKELVLGDKGILQKWTKMGIKGWRFDVIDELDVDFTTQICQKIKSIDSEVLLVGEVWEDATTKVSYDEWRPYFMGEQLDSVMNYPFKSAIIDYVLLKNKEIFIEQVTTILENYPKESLDTLLNLVDSHDTSRAITVLSEVKAPESKHDRWSYRLNCDEYARGKHNLKLAAILQYTLSGVPCIFYADEVGKDGFEDPMNRATFPWNNQDIDLLNHYIALGELRVKYQEILKGVMIFQYDSELLVYDRISTENTLRVYANPNDYGIYREIVGHDAFDNKSIEGIYLYPNSAKIVLLKTL